jgi:hypothetical protein
MPSMANSAFRKGRAVAVGFTDLRGKLFFNVDAARPAQVRV